MRAGSSNSSTNGSTFLLEYRIIEQILLYYGKMIRLLLLSRHPTGAFY